MDITTILLGYILISTTYCLTALIWTGGAKITSSPKARSFQIYGAIPIWTNHGLVCNLQFISKLGRAEVDKVVYSTGLVWKDKIRPSSTQHLTLS